jgi:hypothetical protein
VDEGQVGFKEDLELWRLLKLVQEGRKRHLRMLIVSEWGSHCGPRASGAATPISWDHYSVVGLWPTNETSVSLQLTDAEAKEVWESWKVHEGLGDSI